MERDKRFLPTAAAELQIRAVEAVSDRPAHVPEVHRRGSHHRIVPAAHVAVSQEPRAPSFRVILQNPSRSEHVPAPPPVDEPELGRPAAVAVVDVLELLADDEAAVVRAADVVDGPAHAQRARDVAFVHATPAARAEDRLRRVLEVVAVAVHGRHIISDDVVHGRSPATGQDDARRSPAPRPCTSPQGRGRSRAAPQAFRCGKGNGGFTRCHPPTG